jgi:glutamyl-tRNA synthetase
MRVRVRFAPSPTGFLHVGGGRTALYNWVFARGRSGTFILRSDDTDRARSTPGFAADIIESLQWLGLDWDEGIAVGGPHEPYRQSLRFDRYREVAYRLVDKGMAYYSFATSEQLDAFRREAQATGSSPAYDGRYRVSDEEARRRLDGGEEAPIRFAVPRPGATVFTDQVKGEMRFDHAQVDDFVILRSDGSPTYHLASTVDDVDFEISHVIRGEDLLSSTPKHILLTEAMGAVRATYAHLSLLMGPDGSKLSKRHGHTALQAYREDGYLPEAVRNYLALLGWSPGEDEELISLTEMVERFRLEDVSTNPAVFDTAKLEWMNGVYIRELSHDEFVARSLPWVVDDLGRGLDADELLAFREMAPLVQERTKLLTEVAPQVRFLFADVTYDESSWKKVMTKPEVPTALAAAQAALTVLDVWSTETIEEALRGMLEEQELSARKGLQPLRVAISGSSVSPPLFESMDVLGKDRTLDRIGAAAAQLVA